MDKSLLQYWHEDAIAVEMARRKLQFHNDEEWHEIDLWLLTRYVMIRHYLADGRLINTGGYKPENVTWWLKPSEDYWLNHIKPIVEQFSVEELMDTFSWGLPSSVYRLSLKAAHENRKERPDVGWGRRNYRI